MVLVVDDDDDLRESLQMALTASGYRVATASGGAEALAWMRTGHNVPCLVLLDLMMPGMDGFQVRTTMLGDPELASVPVVVITGAGVLVNQRAGDLHAADILRKPVGLSTLRGTIDRFCVKATPSAVPR
jgi:CheY-like chemotaxis protein